MSRLPDDDVADTTIGANPHGYSDVAEVADPNAETGADDLSDDIALGLADPPERAPVPR